MRTLLLAIFIISSTSSVSAQAPVQLSGTDKAANAPTDKVSDPDQAIKCRTVRVTGSLVKKGKVCKTLAQWRAMTDSGNDLARRLVEDGTSRPSGQ
jgi:hypothetical protein